MTQLTIPNPQDLQGQMLFDVEGEGIGVVEGVYLDNLTRTPEWAAVRLGPDSLALVPLAEASLVSGGVQVDYDRAMVQSAPHRLSGLDSEVTEETEDQLMRYYAGDGGSSNGRAAAVADAAQEVAGEVKEQAADVAGEAKEQAAEVAGEAREQAADVAAAAKEQAVSVVETAKEETAEVVQQASAEARELYETTKTEVQQQAETQLEQFAETLHRLAGQTLALARGNADQAGPVGEVVGRAGQELRSMAQGIQARGSAGLLQDAQRVVRQRPRAAIIGTAVAVVAGAKVMGTPAGERLKEKLAPLKDQAIEAGRNVAEELKPVAQQRVEQMKAVATQAADQVKQEAQGTAEDVKGTATRAGKTVKGTAKQSVTEVKGTARQSSTKARTAARSAAASTTPEAAPPSSVRSSTGPKPTVRRTARPAAPVV